MHLCVYLYVNAQIDMCKCDRHRVQALCWFTCHHVLNCKKRKTDAQIRLTLCNLDKNICCHLNVWLHDW